MSTETVPHVPHDLDAERAVLGTVMDSRRALEEVTAAGLEPHHFYRPAHQTVFAAVRDLADAGDPVNPVAVVAALTKSGDITRVGGAPYLHDLVAAAVPAAQAGWFARIVQDRHTRREIVQAGIRVTQLGSSEAGDVDDLVEQVRETVDGVTAPPTAATSMTRLGDTLAAYLDALEQPVDSSDFVPLPYQDLNDMLGGLRPGQLVVVAGRPGMGKTTLATDFARCAAIRHQLPTAVFSLEMSTTELTHRIMAAEARVPLHALIRHELTDDDWQRVGRVAGDIGAAPLHIDDTPTATLAHIRARLRHLARTTPARLVIVDYLQLMSSPGRVENRQQEVSAIARGLKLLAKEFGTTIVVGAQLNRGPEQRADKKPMVADLRESGAIEQDADVVMLLYRDDVYEKESPRAGELDIIVGKHRNGATGTVTVAYQGHYARATDMHPGA